MAAEDSTVFISAFKPFSGVTLHDVLAHGSAPMNQSHHTIPAYAYHPTAVNAALRRKVKPYCRRVSDRANFLFFGYSPGRQTPQNARNCTQKKGSTHRTVTAVPLMSSPIPYHTLRNFVNTLTQHLSHDASERPVSHLPLRNPTTLAPNRKRSSVRYGKPLGAWRSK